jgi:hypothetical protein
MVSKGHSRATTDAQPFCVSDTDRSNKTQNRGLICVVSFCSAMANGEPWMLFDLSSPSSFRLRRATILRRSSQVSGEPGFFRRTPKSPFHKGIMAARPAPCSSFLFCSKLVSLRIYPVWQHRMTIHHPTLGCTCGRLPTLTVG